MAATPVVDAKSYDEDVEVRERKVEYMSTRVYNAFKVKDPTKVWEVLADIRRRGRENVVERMRAYYLEKMDEIDPANEEYRAALALDRRRHSNPERPFSEVWTRVNFVQEKLREGFKRNATSMQRDTLDPDVNVALTRHETGFYLRAFCDPVSLLWGSLDFLKGHPELEDFHYQDSTDPPDGFTDEAWRERGRIWDEMTSNGGFFEDQLILEISSWSLFWRLDPWLEVLRELRDKPRDFPIREEVLARQLRRYTSLTEVIAECGLIKANGQDGALVTIQKAKKRSQKGQWVTKIGAAAKVHRNLERAVDHVQYHYCEPTVRRMVDRWRAEAREAKKAKRAAKRL